MSFIPEKTLPTLNIKHVVRLFQCFKLHSFNVQLFNTSSFYFDEVGSTLIASQIDSQLL